MLAKRDEFELVSQFLKGDKETKSFLFDEMMGVTSSLLSELKIVLTNGTKEEKKKILQRIKLLRHVMQAHYQSIKAKANISNEELNLIIEHLVAKSPTYRHQLSQAKQEIETHKEELNKFVKHKSTKIKSVNTRSKWIRS